MTGIIKTGAWLHRATHNDYFRCDLYLYNDSVLLARCNPSSRTRHLDDDEGMWATMHEYDNEFKDEDSVTFVSTNYDLHYMMQFHNGRYHNVKLT